MLFDAIRNTFLASAICWPSHFKVAHWIRTLDLHIGRVWATDSSHADSDGLVAGTPHWHQTAAAFRRFISHNGELEKREVTQIRSMPWHFRYRSLALTFDEALQVLTLSPSFSGAFLSGSSSRAAPRPECGRRENILQREYWREY